MSESKIVFLLAEGRYRQEVEWSPAAVIAAFLTFSIGVDRPQILIQHHFSLPVTWRWDGRIQTIIVVIVISGGQNKTFLRTFEKKYLCLVMCICAFVNLCYIYDVELQKTCVMLCNIFMWSVTIYLFTRCVQLTNPGHDVSWSMGEGKREGRPSASLLYAAAKLSTQYQEEQKKITNTFEWWSQMSLNKIALQTGWNTKPIHLWWKQSVRS